MVAGNWIGTNAAGATDLGNAGHGLDVIDSTNNTIGGPTADAGNVICANGLGGIAIYGQGCSDNLVENDYVGVDGTGEDALGNGRYGIFIGEGAWWIPLDLARRSTTRSRVSSAPGMLRMASSSEDRVLTGNVVEDSLIGTDATGSTPLRNAGDGIVIEDGAAGNIIGGTTRGAGNIIDFNGGDGVTVGLAVLDAAVDNAILGNSIFANSGLGIDVDNTAPQAAPVLIGAISAGSQTTIAGTVTGAPNTSFRIEFYSNPVGTSQGKTYLGFLDVTTNGTGSGSFSFLPVSPVAPGLDITATATDANGNTSEFSTGILNTLLTITSIAPVTPNPCDSSVSTIDVTFSELINTATFSIRPP